METGYFQKKMAFLYLATTKTQLLGQDCK